MTLQELAGRRTKGRREGDVSGRKGSDCQAAKSRLQLGGGRILGIYQTRKLGTRRLIRLTPDRPREAFPCCNTLDPGHGHSTILLAQCRSFSTCLVLRSWNKSSRLRTLLEAGAVAADGLLHNAGNSSN